MLLMKRSRDVPLSRPQGCCEDRAADGQGVCYGPGDNYRIPEISSCDSGERKCGTLPITNFYQA